MVRKPIKHLLVAKTGTGNPLTNVTFPRADAIGAWAARWFALLPANLADINVTAAASAARAMEKWAGRIR